ncbi:MAG TPA: hypothetical protein VKP59_05250 [Candidatus Thermoplasmatota archaeon]|nr:hypothetical protein [Candidatus Thermoplasmatota archaeon]
MIIKKIVCSFVVFLFLTLAANIVFADTGYDVDPLSNVEVTVCVNHIRFLEQDVDINPSFQIMIWIDDKRFDSPIHESSSFVYDLNWSVTVDVDDTTNFLPIRLELVDTNSDRLCDISPIDASAADSKGVDIVYDIRTGWWTGDDSVGMVDKSGYGRLNGCDDGSFYKNEMDCELWFSITQSDPDGDGVPSWIETNWYGTDPKEDDSLMDADNDNVPLVWEHHFGFNPCVFDDHDSTDPDEDGLTNYEEYMMATWSSDPFRRDLFLELDQMEIGPHGEGSMITQTTEELIQSAYDRRNIVFHLDDGCMGGGEVLPFEETSFILFDREKYYKKHFLEDGGAHWRRGVFRYGLIVYDHVPISGLEFHGDGSIIDFCRPGLNCFVISSNAMEIAAKRNRESIDFIFACAIFHELGHSMGIYMGNPKGCDNQLSKTPLGPGWWRYNNYKSSMNYHYAYKIIDYSDGSHGRNDFDDWSYLDVSWFEYPDGESNPPDNDFKNQVIRYLSGVIIEIREWMLDRFFRH